MVVTNNSSSGEKRVAQTELLLLPHVSDVNPRCRAADLIGEPVLTVIMVTVGLSCFFRGLVGFLWGTDTVVFKPEVFPSEQIVIGNIVIGQVYVWSFIAALALLVDAYASKYSIPVHLATQESFSLYSDSLVPDGLLAVNIISAVEGPKSGVFRSIASTAKEAFPYQAAIYSGNGSELTNVILVASKAPFKPGYVDSLKKEFTVAENWEPGEIFTDERSSLDYAMMQVLE